MSTFNGKTSEIPWLSIDEFSGVNLDSTCFLLSHCHTDHMNGINKYEFINHLRQHPHIFLYCSEITATILQYCGLESVMDQIIVLPIHGTTIVKVPSPDPDSSDVEISVSMVPAGHCPGSVMFLLEGSWGTVLYTGDFRLAKGDGRKLNALTDSAGRVKRITSLYLDTTFMSLREDTDLHFPSREESSKRVCELVAEWLKKGSNNVVNLLTSAKYGSEYLILEIAKTFRTQVHISEELYRVYRHIPEIEQAVTRDPSARIHCCWYKGKSNRCACLLGSNVRTIKPSVLWWYHRDTKDTPMTRKKYSYPGSDYWHVFYSCHSSHREIVDLVSYLRPSRIEPCVVPQDATRQQVVDVCSSLLTQYQPKRPIVFCSELPAAKVARLTQSADEESSEEDSPTTSPQRRS